MKLSVAEAIKRLEERVRALEVKAAKEPRVPPRWGAMKWCPKCGAIYDGEHACVVGAGGNGR